LRRCHRRKQEEAAQEECRSKSSRHAAPRC
jgi:hypothetical protein